MHDKYCNVCPHVCHEKNFARHMRRHHMYWCDQHLDHKKAQRYDTQSTGWLECGCKQRLSIGRSSGWWRTLKVARASLARELAGQPDEESDAEEPQVEEPQAEMPWEEESEHGNELAQLPAEGDLAGNVLAELPAEGDLAGNEANVVDDFPDSPAVGNFAGNESEFVQYDDGFADFTAELAGTEGEDVENDDFAVLLAQLDVAGNDAEVGDGSANLPAEEKLVRKKAEDQPRLRPRGYGSLPAMGAYGGNPSLPRQFIRLPDPVDPEDRQRQLEQPEDALPADDGAQEIAAWDKALLRNRVTSIACIRMLHEDKTIGWIPGSNEIAYGANNVCRFDAVCVAAEFAPRMASLLAARDADHPLVLFLRGQSGSGKTWLTRKLLEPLEGEDISITSFEGGAATRAIPPLGDKRRAVKLTKQLLDEVPKWSKTAKTAANESSSRAVVGYRMDGLLLIDMPGGEVVHERPEETKMINATNSAVLATLARFQKTGKAMKVSTTPVSNRAVEFFLNALRIPGVRVLVVTVLRDTDVSNPKALSPLQGLFQGQRSQQR
ncbi:hypothetical protein FN846DRAFT_914298 [Sphaerosporella brunnea]|uniref:Uncharacterized protein n=1 Tax=Sphaerosporella brunnea TaxID=1250544 RepID=A0A5J5ED01_9PEZI|nr:hypothetical protein FN846DRAFT_914298 [Sphaerosporella brunnea]